MDRGQIEFRQSLVDAQPAAAEQAHEVTALVPAVADPQAASSAVADLLGTSEVGSRAVLDTQRCRLNEVAREHLTGEADRFRELGHL